MKIEKLDISNNKLKVGIIIGILLTASIFILINYLTSRANYRNTESIELAKGTINYSLTDLNVIAMYKIEDGKDVDIDTVPVDGYILSERSYCTIPDSEAQIKDVFSYESSLVHISINKKGTKCYLYFEEYAPTAEDMIYKLKTLIGKDFKILKMPEPIVQIANSEEISNTLYKAEDNYGTSYVFRGNVKDNWVQFANKRWRIIRINGDGTLRLIYQCDSTSCTDTTGENTQIGLSEYKEDFQDDNTYVGYYYGLEGRDNYEETHTNTTKGTIATVIDKWYENNLTSYTKYLSGNTGFCNDRQINNTNEIWWEQDKKTGFGNGSQNTTVYFPFGRLYNDIWLSEQNPTLKCGLDPKAKIVDSNALKRDLFTTNKAPGLGNGKLEYPIALITSDELVMAGGMGGKSNKNYYLYTNQDYWTMSPYMYNGGNAHLFKMFNGSVAGANTAKEEIGVRPVINLKANITFSGGNGTVSTPFVVATN